jgi:hypothetical protein
MRQLTQEEVNQISADNAERFMGVYPEYFGCPYNSTLLLAHLETQIGTQYPYSLENYIAAFEYLTELGVLARRPPAPPSDAEIADATEQQKQEQVRADYQRSLAAQREAQAAQQRTAERNLPLHVLAGIVGQQNAQLRKTGIGGQVRPGSESRRITGDNVGLPAKARQNVITKYPAVKRDSQRFNELVVAELKNLGELNG